VTAAVRSLDDFKQARELGFRVHMLARVVYGLLDFNGELTGYRRVLGNWQRHDQWVTAAWNYVHCLVDDVVWDIGSDGIHWYPNAHELARAMGRIVEQARKDRCPLPRYCPLATECARRILAAKAEVEQFETFVRPHYRDRWTLHQRFSYMKRILGNASKYAERYLKEHGS